MQIAAASTALVLGEERRKNGRWDGNKWSGSTRQGEGLHLDSPTKKAVAQCGLILDTLGPDALREVRDGAAASVSLELVNSIEQHRRQLARLGDRERVTADLDMHAGSLDGTAVDGAVDQLHRRRLRGD